MATLVIRIDPEALEDPDLDIRYEIPDLLEQRSGGLLTDRGYTHDWDTDALLLFLATNDIASALPHVIALLENDRLHGNDLAKASLIGTSPRELEDVEELAVVYPPGSQWMIRRVPGIEQRAFRLAVAGAIAR